MSLPIPGDTYEVLANLSKDEKILVIAWMADSLVSKQAPTEPDISANSPEDMNWPPKHFRFAENLSGKEPWYAGIKPANELTEEERLKVLDELSGAWKDSTPDDLAEQIISSRTISTREINLDE